jgi:hypothetical protein
MASARSTKKAKSGSKSKSKKLAPKKRLAPRKAVTAKKPAPKPAKKAAAKKVVAKPAPRPKATPVAKARTTKPRATPAPVQLVAPEVNRALAQADVDADPADLQHVGPLQHRASQPRAHARGGSGGGRTLADGRGRASSPIVCCCARALTKASIGYQIHDVIEQTVGKDGERIERAIDGRTFERLLEAHTITRDGREVGGDAQV